MVRLNVGLGVQGVCCAAAAFLGGSVARARGSYSGISQAGVFSGGGRTPGRRMQRCVSDRLVGLSAALYPRVPSPELAVSSANQKQTQAAGYASAWAPPFSEIPQSGNY